MATSDLSSRPKSRVIPDYIVAVLSPAAAVVLDFAFDRLSGLNPPVSLFLCAILFAAWIGGPGPALLATALSISAYDFFFLEPIHSFALQPKEIPRLALLAVAGLFVVSLSAAQQRAVASMRRARDQQQATLRELKQLNETLRRENAERKRAEDRARRTEQEFQLTVDMIPVLAARYRPDGFMDFRNRTWRNYTGLSQDNLEGQRWGTALHPDDLPMVEREWRTHIATGEPFEIEQRLRRADGEYRWHWVRRVPLRDDAGNVIRWYGVAFDIEDRKRAEDALRLSEMELIKARHELQLTIDTIATMVVVLDQNGKAYFANRPAQEYIGRHTPVADVFDIVHPDDRAMIEELWRTHLATGQPFQTEQRMRRADGEYRWNFMTRVPLRDETGKVVRWYGSGYDIEDRKRAENALRESEARLAEARRELQLTIDSIPVMVSTFEPDGTRSFVNKYWQDYTGHNQQQATGKGLNTSVYYHPEDVGQFDDAWRAASAKGETLSVDVRTRRADGTYRWYTMRRAPLRDERGNIVRWYSVGVDIEDQKVAEEALRRSQAQLANAERELRLTLDTIPTLAWRARADGFAEYLNKRWLDFTGFSQEQALGWGWQAALHPDDRSELRDAWQRMLSSGRPDEVEARMRRFDGVYRWLLFRTEALRDASGAVIGWYGTNTDIEDRKLAESALQRSEAYAAEAQMLSRTGSLAWDIAADNHFWSDQTYQILGFDRSVKPSIDLIMQRVHPDDRARLQHEVGRASLDAQIHDYEPRLLMPDGQIKHLHLRVHHVRYESGKEEVVGALMDVTAAKKSQEALDAAQTALAHAGRVAALGEMSATIAHEVNQPLAAIVTNGQACLRFLRRETPDLDDVRGALEWIVKDGNRASEVIGRVRGLLKNAQTRKVLLDVNDIIREVVALLQRELTSRLVTLRLELSPVIALTIADRVQLQQVVINLVMNGVDAMQAINDRPRVLVISSYEDDAGQVVVAVKDSGVGIPGESAARVFDAFFSTKPGGLGIGLSICRSIIEDLGGRLWTSHDDESPGATFRFALPADAGRTLSREARN